MRTWMARHLASSSVRRKLLGKYKTYIYIYVHIYKYVYIYGTYKENIRNVYGKYKDFHWGKVASRQAMARLSLAKKRRSVHVKENFPSGLS